jgi:hypothetical protein
MLLGVISWISRYQIVGSGTVAYRLDRWTGEVVLYLPSGERRNTYENQVDDR